MAPVAGSAYTYAYTTLGEIFAWIIGWDLILEYAMGCATVASAWSGYFNEFLLAISRDWLRIPLQLLSDPFTTVDGWCQPWLNLPSVLHHGAGHHRARAGHSRERTDQRPAGDHQAGVVLFVIAVGWAYVDPANWTRFPCRSGCCPQERVMPGLGQEPLDERHSEPKPAACDA